MAVAVRLPGPSREATARFCSRTGGKHQHSFGSQRIHVRATHVRGDLTDRPVEAALLCGFTYVGRSGPVARLQVGNSPGNLEDARVSAGGEPEASDRRLSGGSDRKSAPPSHCTQNRKDVEVGVTRDEREVVLYRERGDPQIVLGNWRTPLAQTGFQFAVRCGRA